MKLAFIVADIAALGVLIGAANQVLPALAGLLAVIWYGFAIYDRIRYGHTEGAKDKGVKSG